MWKSFSRAIFWKPLLRTANGRSVFPLEKTVSISKIGQREPLSFSVWKFLVEVAFKNGAFWASEPWITITLYRRSESWWRAPTTKLLMFRSSFQSSLNSRSPCNVCTIRPNDQFQSRGSTGIKSSKETVILR